MSLTFPVCTVFSTDTVTHLVTPITEYVVRMTIQYTSSAAPKSAIELFCAAANQFSGENKKTGPVETVASKIGKTSHRITM